MGRIVGSICVLTTCNNNVHRGVLTSGVSQATFNPPGVMIALPQELDTNWLADPETKFVLNILNEGRSVRKNFSPNRSSDSFGNLTTKTASNGCSIIEEALAYLECTVQNHIDSGDYWLIYATVDNGEVLQSNGITAMQHRKSGSHY